MKLKLCIRQITDFDIGEDCPFPPHPSSFKHQAKIFIETLHEIEAVKNVMSHEDYIIVEMSENSAPETFLLALMTIHQEFWMDFRISGIIDVTEVIDVTE